MEDRENSPGPSDSFVWRGKRRRGRPIGSKNAFTVARSVTAAVDRTSDERRIPDVAELIANQLRAIARAQSHMAKEGGSIRDLAILSNALDTAVAAVARAAKSHEEILARMSHAEQLEAAVRRIEDQDPPAIALVIRRLKEGLRENEGPRGIGSVRAVDVVRDLE